MPLNDKQREEFAKIQEKIKDVDIAMLTTRDVAKGTLHSRPMSTNKQVDPGGTIWFFTYGNSEKAHEIENFKNVNLSYSAPNKQLYVSISGTAEVIEDKAKMKESWNPILKAWFPDELETRNIALLKVTVQEAEYWDSNSNKMVQLFQIVKAIVTSETATYGDHEKIDLQKH